MLRDSIDTNAPSHPALGIEIEVENARVPENDMRFWNVTSDGSLRNNGIEFISRGPIKFDDIEAAILEYVEAVDVTDAEFTHGIRTSVHVHTNVGFMSKRQFNHLIKLYIATEHALFALYGEDRMFSPYCVPMFDASHALAMLNDLMANDFGRVRMGGRDFKYCALGLCRLYDLGTLEFRMFTGTNDADQLLAYATAVMDLTQAARAKQVNIEAKAAELIVKWGGGEHMIERGVEMLDQLAMVEKLGAPRRPKVSRYSDLANGATASDGTPPWETTAPPPSPDPTATVGSEEAIDRYVRRALEYLFRDTVQRDRSRMERCVLSWQIAANALAVPYINVAATGMTRDAWDWAIRSFFQAAERRGYRMRGSYNDVRTRITQTHGDPSHCSAPFRTDEFNGRLNGL